jgi:hypothetical protein
MFILIMAKRKQHIPNIEVEFDHLISLFIYFYQLIMLVDNI